jgi:hypothetical protein
MIFTGARLHGVPSGLHLTGLVSGHGHQGQTHWLLFLFEVKGRLTLLPPAHSGGGSNFSRAMVHTRLVRAMRKAERRAAP